MHAGIPPPRDQAPPPHPPGPGRPPRDQAPPPHPTPDQTPPRDLADSPPGKQTPAYGLRAAGTHPTGMHSCCSKCSFKMREI